MGKEHCWRETFALIRLHILAEGQAEEGFINNVLSPALGPYNVFADTHRITTGRRHGRISRGGLTNYEQLARDLVLWMKQDQNEESWFTTMIDFYKLPDNFPGREAARRLVSVLDQVVYLEGELSKDVGERLGDLPVAGRLVPYIQLYEFEALLFSDPTKFIEAFPNEAKAVGDLVAVRGQFSTPEEIDGNPLTAPSKRILNLLPDYQKPVAGILIAQQIGLERIRNECPHFDDWVTRLVGLAD